MIAQEWKIGGLVQGVGYRFFVFRLARQSQVAGWVRNAPHIVEVHAEGDPDAMERFDEILRTQVPPGAHVSSFEVRDARVEGLRDFTIRPSSRI